MHEPEHMVPLYWIFCLGSKIRIHENSYTVNSYRQKFFVLFFFSTRICIKLCSKFLLQSIHTIKLLPIKIIDTAGRKKKCLPTELKTLHTLLNSVHNYVICLCKFSKHGLIFFAGNIFVRLKSTFCPKLLSLENPFEFIWNLRSSFENWNQI